MKKIFTKLMLLAVAAAALVSCENNYEEQTPVVELTQTVTLSAEKPTQVRTELIEGVPYWSKGDQIGVYVQDGESYKNYAFKNDNEEATLTTSFTGTTAVANTLFVYYPYVAGSDVINDNGCVKATIPSAQQPTVASFDGAADIMIAKPVTLDEEGNQLSDLEFARVAAIVKVVLKDKTGNLAGQHVSSLTMTAETNLTGKVYLDVIKQELGELYSNKSQSVTANYTPATQFVVDGENAVYLVVYPQVLASGSNLTFEATTEGYTITKEITLSQDINLAMGKVTTLNVSLEATNVEEIETIEWVNNAYNLVPNITGLAIGDKVVIAAANYDVALSTTQNSNNRGETAITKNANSTIEIDNTVEVLTVEAGKIDGTFAFKTSDNKYLYAASSSSNYLRSEATLSDNSSFLVTIADGIVTATAQGTNTHNILRYNDNNNMFSCYNSGQQDISIYKLVGEYVVKAPAITLSIAGVTVEHDATSGEATVTATNGDGWAINATTDATWVSNLAYADGKITFTTEANDGDARTATVNVTATKADYEDVTTTFTISQNAKPAAGGPTTVVDVLDYAFTGLTGNGYTAWSGKTGTSGAVYAGQSNAGVKYIQLRNTSPSGIITTKSGGKVRKVVVTWSTSQNTSTGRQITIYGKNTAYSVTTDVYNTSNRGTSLGTIKKDTNTELTINGDYEYIGILASGALYMDKIEITWETGSSEGGETPETPAPELAITTTSPIAVGAEGDVATVAYTITNPVEGKSVTASADQTWVNGFDYTVAGEVSFIVDANTGAAREATVTLAYEGAESKTIKVSQAAGNTGGGDSGKTSYVLITNINDLTSGEYIMAAYANNKYIALPTNPTVSSGKIVGNEITVTNNEISETDADGYVWTFTKSGNYYTVSDGAQNLYHSNGGTSGTNLTYGASTSYVWSITYDKAFVFAGVTNNNTVNGRGMLYQIGTVNKFGGYSLSNKAGADYSQIYLFKKSN